MNLHFATPWALALIPFVIALAILPRIDRGLTRPAGMRFSDNALVRDGSQSWKVNARQWLPVLRWLTIVLVIIAVARPQSGQAREIVTGEGVDIVLALDISGSMSAEDFVPLDRLEAAKEVIADFISERKYDRVGLVVFAANAFTNSPPTIDHRVLEYLLEDMALAAELGLEDGTAIGMGLGAAANMLKDSDSESKVVILLTDGVNNKGIIDPLTAATAAKAIDVRVYTIGMGRPELSGTQWRGFLGNRMVIGRYELDEETLRQIADITGGQYFTASDLDGLRTIYDEINELEKSEVDVRRFTRYRELAGWLLIPVPLLLLLELFARSTKFRSIP
ncbi:MAG: VWA domain-containing protein [SAR202 cluster bacterium]|jgi:Ca-activated chloride channel family protein|nr:VWA domain-containing protein [SAR202 cluster bacterium]MDP6301732.1 VWA domain-containing protein [SAR202 cluster bacterium]MDP7103218.1 VWA domain-containing protein [SAR202 cluster bacterium]MDP7224652.1 VWA domain-containing protein [SAR202 cluster bacterium]MDP7414054.1 VWA domain-containing protein [SAR202 cluster bacterium]|tara:strand:- start:9581 stop:10585 length:1005 start_codon:yes stop_codon:yes gene_type:complete